MRIIWCKIPEICSTTDRIFCHFGPFFALLAPLATQKKKIGKMKKTHRNNIIILHMCTIHYDHMMYGSWNMEHNRQNILLFWAFFCPLISLTTKKIKILKKWKKTLEIWSFYTSVQKSLSYAILFLRYGTWRM